MFVKAGAWSLALLLLSRLLGLLRESAQAAAFGSSGLTDVVVLMLTLPDWLASVMAAGVLAYVLLPAWAGQSAAQLAESQRRVARWLLIVSLLLGLLLAWFRVPAARWLAAGLPPELDAVAAQGLGWSALALPAALLASLWTTRLQHERDFAGMYAANLLVNGVLIASILVVAWSLAGSAGSVIVPVLGAGLLAAMASRLLWLHWRQLRLRQQRPAPPRSALAAMVLPAATVWWWAGLSAGLPLALPFVARSIASQGGEGALATFNFAWKLVELPLVLAIQLVAALAFPGVARALAGPAALAAKRADADAYADADADADTDAARVVRGALALAWTLACAAAAGLLVGAPVLARLLFGWGRMDAQSLQRIADWGAVGAWGLLPQAVIAVGLTVLAVQQRMRPAVLAYAAALAVLGLFAAAGVTDGASLMWILNAVLSAVAVLTVLAIGPAGRHWVPWRALAAPFGLLLGVAALSPWSASAGADTATGVALVLAAAALVMAGAWFASAELRATLRR